MEGLIAEGKKRLMKMPIPVKDAALIAAAQRVEHYEMAGYGCVRACPPVGEEDAELLQETLDEEGSAARD
ncbi:MAG: DUF892 family protein [Planctomycetaceae bacterium]